VVTDFISDDGDYAAVLQEASVETVYLRVPIPFLQSRGLNTSFHVASGPVVFFCDCDILLSREFIDRLLSVVKPGVAYFPICWASPSSGSTKWYWRTGAYGLCAFTKPDFLRFGPWNEKAATWGYIDNQLLAKCKGSIKIVREKVPDLVHMWHPHTKTDVNWYYGGLR